jgi:hypothetical protein
MAIGMGECREKVRGGLIEVSLVLVEEGRGERRDQADKMA